MLRAKERKVLVLAALLALLTGCQHAPVTKNVPPPPQAASQSLIVLLPDPYGKTTAISVTNSAGTEELTQPYQAVQVESASKAPGTPVMLNVAEVNKRFGDLIAGLPAPEISFLLYFPQDSDQLTPESSALLSQILAAVRERRSTSISVVGHTDTTGGSQANYRLGLRRAQAVADILLRQGAVGGDISVESHGDADLLIKTGRGVLEPRNRRVEVVVR